MSCMETIETIASRKKTLQLMLAGTTISVIIGLGIVGENEFIADNYLRNRAFTDNEFVQYKQALATKMENKEIVTFDEKEDYVVLLNECTIKNPVMFTDVTEKNFSEKIQGLLKSCI